MLQPMAEVLDTEEEAMEEDILPKFVVFVEGQDIPLIHAIKSMTFHLISSSKIRIMISESFKVYPSKCLMGLSCHPLSDRYRTTHHMLSPCTGFMGLS